LRRDLALRLSGLAIGYDSPGTGRTSAIGRRVPDLELRGAPAPSVYGLLRAARFVLLRLTPRSSSWPSPSLLAGYRDRLDVVSAQLADERSQWADVRALLIRPDGHVGWALRGDDPDDQPPLAAWLGPPRT
jgi:hypothetical protein